MMDQTASDIAQTTTLRKKPLEKPVLRFPSPYLPMFFLAVSVVVVEGLIEFFLDEYLRFSLMTHILLDSALMVVLLSPVFYYFLYLPYKRHHRYHNQAEAQIHYLSQQLINASENERKLLSQNLHDDFGQILTAMQFGVETIKGSCLVSDEQSGRCLMQMERLSEQISDLGDHVRDISTSLHPHILDELGVEAALRWHLEEYGKLYKEVQVNAVFSDIEIRFPAEIELTLFRICQESLNNIAKHAAARKVKLSLALERDILNMTIEDDGQGFNLEGLKAIGAKKSGIGLLGMRARVSALGGRLDVASAPGKGTTIKARIPAELRRRKHEAYSGLDR